MPNYASEWSLALLLVATATAPATSADPLTRIAFGSCANQNHAQPVWAAILKRDPELFLFLGDNVYADSTDPQVIREAYAKLSRVAGFGQLRESCPLLATWDDHDYGINDGGKNHPTKKEAQAAFQDFFDIPPDSPLRRRAGVYHAQTFGPIGKRVQVLLLDTRYHRDKLAQIKIAGRPFYVPNDDRQLSMLGEQQWNWLATQLRQPAEVRLIVSSIQVLPTDHPFEKWQNFPHERRRLLDLLHESSGGAVLLLSGDQHFGEATKVIHRNFAFHEVTSSGLTHHRGNIAAPNSNRIGRPLIENNFGMLEIDWEARHLVATICDVTGAPRIVQRFAFSALTPPGPL